MAVPKWASTGLGWGGGLSRLRTPSAAPWDGDSTQKLPLGGMGTASLMDRPSIPIVDELSDFGIRVV